MKFHPTVPGLHEAIHELCAAITAETQAFRNTPDDDAGEIVANAAIDRVIQAYDVLLTFKRSDVERDMAANGGLALVHALALHQQRWLVMEGSYQKQKHQGECLLVDLILSGAEPLFLDVPLFWHVNGSPRDTRPSDAELQAGWDK